MGSSAFTVIFGPLLVSVIFCLFGIGLFSLPPSFAPIIFPWHFRLHDFFVVYYNEESFCEMISLLTLLSCMITLQKGISSCGSSWFKKTKQNRDLLDIEDKEYFSN